MISSFQDQVPPKSPKVASPGGSPTVVSGETVSKMEMEKKHWCVFHGKYVLFYNMVFICIYKYMYIYIYMCIIYLSHLYHMYLSYAYILRRCKHISICKIPCKFQACSPVVSDIDRGFSALFTWASLKMVFPYEKATRKPHNPYKVGHHPAYQGDSRDIPKDMGRSFMVFAGLIGFPIPATHIFRNFLTWKWYGSHGSWVPRGPMSLWFLSLKTWRFFLSKVQLLKHPL